MSYARRTTADRLAEAAVYRARSEAAAQAIPTVELSVCEYNKERKVLGLTSNYVNGFPRELMVKSHHSGKEIRFVVIGPEDKLFDQDGWDGEQQIYRPTSNCNVDHMVIHHAC